MPNVLNEYVGDGSTKSFTFAMAGGYLNRDYVQFYVRPAEDLLAFSPLTGNPVTWTGPFSFTLTNPIPVGTVLAVMRETPLEPLVDFQNTSRITEKNLDTGIHQPMHKVAELSDLVDRINTVAGDAQDVANSSVETSAEALATANAANAAAAAATNTANGATATANGAVDTANAAAASASSAKSTANTALTQAGQANTKATTAIATANAASNAADNAVGVAGNAANTASQALTRATDAFNAADSALTTANAAATSANAASNAAAASASAANTAKNDAQAAASAAATAQTDAADAKSTAISAAQQAGTAASLATAANTKATEALDKANTAIADAGTALANSTTAAADAASARATAEAALDLVEDATSGSVSSFNGRSGSVVPMAGDYTKAMVGLGNVDNTSDADKPISTATAAALAEKAGASELAALSTSIQDSMDPRITAVENATAANASALAGKAPMVHTHKIADITDFNPAAYMPKSGGTFTGAVSFNGLSTNTVAAVGSNSITYTATKHIFSGELEGTFKGNVTGNLSGNAATANSAAKLTTARTINGVAFDGSQNITINAADPTKMPLAGGTFTGPVYTGSGWTVRMAGNVWLGGYSTNAFGIRATTTDGYAGVQFCGTDNEDYGSIIGTADRIQFNKTLTPVGNIPMRMISGNRAALILQTGNALYFLTTNENDQWSGSWNHLRPFHFSLVTGKVSMEHGVDVTGGDVWVGGGRHVLSTGNVIAYYSDKRLKKDIRPVTDALDIVRSLTAYRYRANAVAASYGYDSSKDEVGLLAQDVQAVLPEVVERAPFDTAHDGSSKSGENFLTLKYERLVPVLLQAIKELEARVRALEEA